MHHAGIWKVNMVIGHMSLTLAGRVDINQLMAHKLYLQSLCMPKENLRMCGHHLYGGG